MTSKLEARARRALANKDIKFIFDGLPSEYHDNPKALRQLLTGVAEGFSLADSAAYKEAHAALAELQGARELQNRIATAYHDPRLRAEVSETRLAAALADPETAYQELIQRSASGKLSPALETAFRTLGEVREYNRSAGQEWTAAAPAPVSNNAGSREAEIASLLKRSAAGSLTKSEDARLDRLYEARLATEAATPSAPTQPAPRATDFDRLIQKSISGALSADEDARLNALSEQRAIDQGLVDPADLPNTTNSSEGTESNE